MEGKGIDMMERKGMYEQLVMEGRTLEEIAEEMGVKKTSAYNYLLKKGLLEEYRKRHPLKQNFKKRKYEGIEKFVENGSFTLRKIGEIYGVSKERIRQVLEDRGLHERYLEIRTAGRYYKEAVEEGKTIIQMARERGIKISHVREALRKFNLWDDYEKNSVAAKLANAIALIAMEKAKSDKAAEKTLEYLFRRRNTPYNFDTLYSFFKRYYRAKEAGERVSIDKLIEGLDIPPVNSYKILREVGEKTLARPNRKKVKRLTKEQKELVDRAIEVNTRLSANDIGRILGIPSYVILRRMSLKGIKSENKRGIGFLWEEGTISYSKAMDLYEALDAGFSKDKAAEYANIRTEKGFELALKHREEVEKEVKRFMRELGLQEV